MNQEHAITKGVPIRAVSRAIEILQIINRIGNPTIMEIKSESGLPYATVFRVVHTLIHEGLIECEPKRKRYRPTELVWSLGMGFQQADQLAQTARPILGELTAEHYWPVAMSVRIGDRMVVKDSTHTLTTQTFINYYPGYSLPLLGSGAGRAYIAFCPEEERQIIFNSARLSKDEETQWNLQILEDEAYLADVREKGYATHARLQHNETPGKTSSLAVPIVVDGILKACLAMVYFENAMKVEEAAQKYAPAMLAAAKRIAESIEGKSSA